MANHSSGMSVTDCFAAVSLMTDVSETDMKGYIAIAVKNDGTYEVTANTFSRLSIAGAMSECITSLLAQEYEQAPITVVT